MKCVMLLGAVLVASVFAGNVSDASAQGLYIGVGHSRYYGGWHGGGNRRVYNEYGKHGFSHRMHHPGHWGGHYWHDTSHYDYHPGGYVRHYNHYDYVPGHYDYHETGHWHH